MTSVEAAVGTAGPTWAPLTLAQERIWLLEQLGEPDGSFNVFLARRVRGPVDREALRRAVDALSTRHAALRTGIHNDAAGVRQDVATDAGVTLTEFAVDRDGPDDPTVAERARAALSAAVNAPFDLATPPLGRVVLGTVAPDEHLLALVVHHVVCDGWSMQLLLADLDALYRHECDGTAAVLPELPRTHLDHARDQHEVLRGERLDREVEYWSERCADLAPLTLGGDRARHAPTGSAGASVWTRVAPDLRARLAAYARRRRCTESTVLLAAYQVLLARWTGVEVFGVGAPSAARADVDTAGLVGLLTDTVVLRSDLSGSPTFDDVVRAARAATLDAIAHPHVPFEQIRGQAGLGGADAPFQVMFNAQTYTRSAGRLGDADLEPYDVEFPWSKVDLTLEVWPDEHGIDLNLEYRTALLDADTVGRFGRCLLTVLDGLLTAPDRPVARVPLLTVDGVTADDWEQVVHRFNDAPVTGAVTPTVVDAIARTARERPGAVAVACGYEQVTYAELAVRAGGVTDRLRAAGIGPRDVVGVCAGRSVDLVVALVAVAAAGAVYLPLDPGHPPARLAAMLADGGARHVLVDDRAAGRLPVDHDRVELPVGAPSDHDPRHEAGWLDDAPGPADPAYLIFTSGSTGRPKGVVTSHGALARRAAWMRQRYALGEGDVVLQYASINFDTHAEELFPALMSGATVLEMDEDPRALRDFLGGPHGRRITVLDLPTSMWHELVTFVDRVPWPPALRLLVLGADQVSAGALARWRAHVGDRVEVVNTYGPTEATVIASAQTLGAEHVGTTPPIGRPIADTRLYVLDTALRPVPIGVAGQLYIGGDGLAFGYHGDPVATATRFLPDPHGPPGSRVYATGDRARWDGHGALTFLGRVDHQLKHHGHRIEPGEVETRLTAHAEVAHAVVGLFDHAGTSHLSAWVLAEAGCDPGPDALQEHLAATLPTHLVPTLWARLDMLPLTANGKLDRSRLPEPAPVESVRAGRVHRDPRTPTEQLVASVFGVVLGVADVAVDGDFFALGGHSLLATQAAGRLEDLLRRSVPVRDVFVHSTVEELAAALDVRHADGVEPDRPVPRANAGAPVPASPAQERMWFLDRLADGDATYNLPVAARLRGPLDADGLQVALDLVVARHEALRTRFEDTGGTLLQVIDGPAHVRLDTQRVDGPEPLARALQVVRGHANTPFDLARGPLVRACLVELGPDDHVLSLVAHHIVSDGWSTGVVLRDLSRAYRAVTAGDRPLPLPPVPLQYADHALWQRRAPDGAEDAAVTHWTRTLRDTPVLALPTTFPRPATRGSAGAFHDVPVPPALRRRVLNAARDHHCTEFMVLMAAFQVLLGRYSGQRDFAVGSPIAGRGSRELDEVVGLFTNTLVLRADLSGRPTFAELLQRVKEQSLDAFTHQDIPFERVISAVRPQRDLGRHPLFDVLFVLQNAPSSGLALDDVVVEGVDAGFAHAKFDLTLEMWPDDDGYRATLGYSCELFDATFVERLGRAWISVLEGLLADPLRATDRVPLLTPSGPTAPDWREVITDFNAAPSVGDRDGSTVVQQIHAAVRRWPAHPAVSCDGVTVTYAELGRRVTAVAGRLRTAGVGPGDVVGVYSARSVDLVVAVVAVLAAGAVYLPLDVEHPPARTAAVLADARARHLVVGAESWGRVPADPGRVDLPAAVPADTAAQADGTGWPAAGPDLDDPAYMIFTSGSTGRPKGVVCGHAGLANRLSWMAAALAVDEHDVIGHKTSVAFDVSVWELLLPLTVGARLDAARPGGQRDPGYLHRWIDDAGVTVLHFVPSMLVAWLDGTVPHHPGLRVVVASGEALPAPVAARFAAAYPAVGLYNLYGPTEASIDVSSHRSDVRRQGTTGGVPMGTPIDRIRLYVLDPWLHPVPPGTAGELYIAGVGLALGYHDDPVATAARFVPDPFGPAGGRMYATGDRAVADEHGVLTYLGRLDDQFKHHGHRIEPGEIEAHLAAHPDIARVAVGLTEHAGGPRLTAWYLTREAGDPGPEQLRAHLTARLPPFLVPTAWHRLTELPVTASGKLDRARLPTAVAIAPLAPAVPTAPRAMTVLERIVADVWAECLGVADVGPDDDFFALGGHSLTAARVVSRLRTALPPGAAALGVMHVFTHPTVRQQARLCRELAASASATLLHRLDRSTRAPRFTLVCFPYAGSSAVVYRPLADEVPDDVAVYAVSIPGHDPGLAEEPQPLDTVAARAAQEVLDAVDGPVALYGHSSGGAFALETARLLERSGRQVVAVYVGAIFPVARPGGALRTVWEAMRRDWLVSDARYAEGLRATGLDLATLHPDDLRRIVRAVRRDARDAETYFTARLESPDDLLRAPIVAVVGERDPDTEFHQERHLEWRRFSTATTVVVIDEADHFFAKFRAPELAEVMCDPTLLPEPDRHPLSDDRDRVPAPGRATGRWWRPAVVAPAVDDPSVPRTRPSMARFLLVAGGQTLSLTGSALTEFALPLWLLLHTGSVARFGLMAVLALLPGLLVGPVAGVVVDRRPRRRVMLAADAAALLIEAAMVAELATGGTRVWTLYLFVAVLSAVLPFQRLAFLSAVPQLVPKQFLGHAAGIVQTGSGLAQFVVPVAAAACFATVGLEGILALDLASYAVCIVTVALVRFPGTLPYRRRESIASELREGFRYVLRRRAFRPLIGFFAALNVVLAPLLLLVSPLVLHFGSLRDVAFVSTAGAVGALTGSLLMTVRGGGRGNPFVACAWTTVVLGAAAVATGLRPSTLLAGLGLAVVLACLAAINVRYVVTVQRKVPRRFHGRAFALLGTAAYSTIPLGFAVIAPLATWLLTGPSSQGWARDLLGRPSPTQDPSVAAVFVVLGVVVVVLGAVTARSRIARSFDRSLPDAPPDDVVGARAVVDRLAGRSTRTIPIADYAAPARSREDSA